jgi:RHS repeat-associated protein
MKNTSQQIFIQFACALGIISVLFCVSSKIHAQTDQTPQRGFHPAGSYAMSDLETINTSNGNTILNVPLASLPRGRGGNPGATLKLLYNSKLLDSRQEIHYDPLNPPDNYTYNVLQASDKGGWRYGLMHQIDFIKREDSYTNSLPQCPSNEALYKFKLSLTFPDGSSHEFRPTGYSDNLNDGYYQINYDGWLSNCGSGGGFYAVTTGMNYYSADGSYLRLFIAHDGDGLPYNNAWTLFYPDGTRVTGGNAPERIYDSNNNYVEIQNITLPNGNPGAKVIDQLGRYFTIEYGHDPTGNLWYDYITATGANNESLQWTVKWKGNWVYRNYIATTDLLPDPPGRLKELFTSMPVVDQITLPSQGGALTYAFAYNGSSTRPSGGNYTNGWGEISQMTLPSGAQSSYQYLDSGENGLMWTAALENSPIRKDLTYNLEYDCGSTSCPSNPTTETWNYTIVPNLFGRVIAPDGGMTQDDFNGVSPPAWNSGLAYKTARPDGSVVERIWQSNAPYGVPASNPYVKTEFVSARDAAGNLVKTAIKDFSYDKNGNVTQIAEYDWVAYNSIPRDGGGHPTGIPGAATLKRVTVNTYYNPTPDATDTTTDDPDVYHKATSPNLKKAIASSETRSAFSAGSAISRTEFFYDSPGSTGNLTLKRSWDSTRGGISSPLTAANSISISHQYDPYGNLTHTIDPKNVTTWFVYGLIDGHENLYVTETKVAANTTVQRWTMLAYDFHTGLVTQSVDLDNNVTTNTTYDIFGRPTQVQEASGTTIERRTVTEYSDLDRRVITRADLDATGDGKLVTVWHYDQLGRIRLSRNLEDAAVQSATDETQGIKVQTRYAYSGPNSFSIVSAPYRANFSYAAGSEAGMSWSRTKFDTGGRIIEMETFGGAVAPFPWDGNSVSTGKVTTQYDAEFLTVIDQAGKMRRSETDALGRLIGVVEAPGVLNYETTYLYDALDNLRKVTQGAQNRWFAYDSLSRLIRSKNPEQNTNGSLPPYTDPVTGGSGWAMAYSYDANSNLTQRIDARGIVTNYLYDQLNRNYAIDYINGSQISFVRRVYDLAVNGKGRLYYDYTAEGSVLVTHMVIDSYDPLGRPLQKRQHFWQASTQWGPGYYTQQTYDLAGNVKTLTYPSGRTVNYSYDQAGRLSSFSGNLGGSPSTYADTIGYNAAAQMIKERFGTNTSLYHNLHYNNRQQLVSIRVGDNPNYTLDWSRVAIDFFYGTTAIATGDKWASDTDNNGNLRRQITWVPLDGGGHVIPQQDDYTYDALNRISSFTEAQKDSGAQWTQAAWQNFSYDRFGNRQITSATGGVNNYNPTYDTTTNTNRIVGLGYDAAGNITFDSLTGGTMTYDAENRLLTAINGGVGSSYTYDADGKRVRKIVGVQETWYIYGVGGELLAEYAVGGAPNSPQKEYGYRGGQLLVVWDGSEIGNRQLQWLVQDHLGSTRMVVDRSGSLGGVRRHDFAPFGEELSAGVGIRSSINGYSGDSVRQKFGSKERDDETKLDYFLARYYSNIQGRFTSPDEFQGGPRELFVLGSGSPTKQALPYADIANPQSINKYVYTYNNPLRYTDPDGHWPDGDGFLDQLSKLLRVTAASLGIDWEPDTEDYDTQAIVNQRMGGRKFGDMMTQDALPAMKETGEILQTFNETIDVTGIIAPLTGKWSGARDNKDVAVAGLLVAGSFLTHGFGKGGILLGENMVDRVIPAARAAEALTYSPREATMAITETVARGSARFVERAIAAGKRIFDIGPAGATPIKKAYMEEVGKLTDRQFQRVYRGRLKVGKDKYFEIYEWVEKQ